MRQTQGAIGFLVSAYRGILRHVFFAALAAAIPGAAWAVDVSTSQNSIRQSDGTYFISADLTQAAGGLNVSGDAEFTGGSAKDVSLDSLSSSASGLALYSNGHSVALGTLTALTPQGYVALSSQAQGPYRAGGSFSVSGAAEIGSSNLRIEGGAAFKNTLHAGASGRLDVTSGGVLTLGGEDARAVFDEGAQLYTQGGRIAVSGGAALEAVQGVFLEGGALKDGIGAGSIEAAGAGSYIKLLNLAEDALSGDFKKLLSEAVSFSGGAQLKGQTEISAGAGQTHVVKGGGLDVLEISKLTDEGASVLLDTGKTAAELREAAVSGGALRIAGGVSATLAEGGSLKVTGQGSVSVQSGGSLALDKAAASFERGSALEAKSASQVKVRNGGSLTGDKDVFLKDDLSLQDSLASGALTADGEGSYIKLLRLSRDDLDADLKAPFGGQSVFTGGGRLKGQTEIASSADITLSSDEMSHYIGL